LKYKKYFRKTSLKQKGVGDFFLKEVEKKSPKTFLEVGVFHGVTARNVCELLYKIHKEDFKYIGLDLFSQNEENKSEIIPNTKFNNPIKEIFFKYIKRQDPYSLESVKNFVRDLGKDDYASLYEINSIDSVLMFIPIEPALLTLYNEAADLIEKAWQKKIIIVGPSTLPFLLKAVENMWRIDKQSKTIKDIAASASEIYDKAVNVYDSFNTVNQSLDKARLKMDEAKSRLQDGPGSLTKKIEKMKKLGRLNTKKQLPEDSGNAID